MPPPPPTSTLFPYTTLFRSYSYVKSLDKKRLNETALKYPASAYGSKEMKEGIKTDTLEVEGLGDRKSTRLNSSHVEISYAVFCLKKKTKATPGRRRRRTAPR